MPSRANQAFWAPSQSWPLGDPRTAKGAFGVLVPTNVPVWKLRVLVGVEGQYERLKLMPSSLWYGRKAGLSTFAATKNCWVAFYGHTYQWIESGPITNSIVEERDLEK